MTSQSPAESSPESCTRPGDAVFDVRSLEVSYSGHPALRSIDLRIPRRGITAIVGPSGCGKSTFLSSLNRLTDLVPGCRVRGCIRFDGLDIHATECDVLQLRRRVGMVFQSPVPFPLSIRRNLLLPLREHGWARKEAEARAEQSLRDVGLWEEVRDRLDAPAPTLSGGQQQRLCIARALALHPEVMLFDEPCSALDPLASGVVEDCITGLSQHVAVVIVTHNLAQARRIANHVAVFWYQDGAGTVIDSGPADSVFESPTSEIAAAYLNGTRG